MEQKNHKLIGTILIVVAIIIGGFCYSQRGPARNKAVAEFMKTQKAPEKHLKEDYEQITLTHPKMMYNPRAYFGSRLHLEGQKNGQYWGHDILYPESYDEINAHIKDDQVTFYAHDTGENIDVTFDQDKAYAYSTTDTRKVNIKKMEVYNKAANQVIPGYVIIRLLAMAITRIVLIFI